jgi:hypothetical protein
MLCFDLHDFREVDNQRKERLKERIQQLKEQQVSLDVIVSFVPAVITILSLFAFLGKGSEIARRKS